MKIISVIKNNQKSTGRFIILRSGVKKIVGIVPDFIGLDLPPLTKNDNLTYFTPEGHPVLDDDGLPEDLDCDSDEIKLSEERAEPEEDE